MYVSHNLTYIYIYIIYIHNIYEIRNMIYRLCEYNESAQCLTK